MSVIKRRGSIGKKSKSVIKRESKEEAKESRETGERKNS